MKSLVQEQYGTPEVLVLRDVAVPSPGPGEVLLRVHAAGIDYGVWHVVTGLPRLVRIGTGLRRPRRAVPGADVAGVVAAVGEGVTSPAPGDEVFGVCSGAFAEYAVARADRLAVKPAAVSFEQAAAVPVSGTTALQALRDQARIRPGQRVLVTGAGGGVGTFAVQLAVAFGAAVTGVCSTGKVELVRSLGAERVVDYTVQDAFDGSARYDVVLDIAGNRPLRVLRRALTPHGTLVIVGGERGGGWSNGLSRQLRAVLLSPVVRQRLRVFVAVVRAPDLAVLGDLLGAGAVTPSVGRIVGLEGAAAALDALADGAVTGKAVVSVIPASAQATDA